MPKHLIMFSAALLFFCTSLFFPGEKQFQQCSISVINEIQNQTNSATSSYPGELDRIANLEYNISFSEEFQAYQSPNRANNIRFIYSDKGFTARTRENRIPLFDVSDKNIREEDKKYSFIDDWSIQFKTVGLARANSNLSDGKIQFHISVAVNLM